MQSLTIISFDPSSYKNLGNCIARVQGNEVSFAASTLVLKDIVEPWHSLWPVFYFADTLLEQEKPDIIILEKTSSFSGGFVTGQVSNTSGCLLAAAGKHKIDVVFVYPSHVKKVVSGKGRATKSQMKKSAVKLMDHIGLKQIKFDSEHSCDALCNILCWMIENNFISKPDEEENNAKK